MAIDMRVLRETYAALAACLDEARLRLWAAAEARSLGHGGIESVARVTGLSRRTIHRGLEALRHRRGPAPLPRLDRARAPGGGRKRLTARDPALWADLEALVEPSSRGDPE